MPIAKVELTCSFCGVVFERVATTGLRRKHGIYCDSIDCRRAYFRERQFEKYVPKKPRAKCENCGSAMPHRNSKFGSFCAKPGCRDIAREKKRIRKNHQMYAYNHGLVEKPFREVPAGERKIFEPIVINSPRCETCRWQIMCRQTVKLRTPVFCELWDEHDKVMYANSDEKEKIDKLLTAALTF